MAYRKYLQTWQDGPWERGLSLAGGGERKKHCSIAMKEFEENLGKGITLTPQQGNSLFIFFFFFMEEIEAITENQH